MASKTIVFLCFLDFLSRYYSRLNNIFRFLLRMVTLRANLSNLNLALIQVDMPKLMDYIWQEVSMLLMILSAASGRDVLLLSYSLEFDLKYLLTNDISLLRKVIFYN